MCAKNAAAPVLLALLLGCGSSSSPGGDGGGGPGVNSSRASRGGSLPDALASSLDGPASASGGSGGTTPPAGAGGSGGTAAGSGGAGGAPPADGPAPVDLAPDAAAPADTGPGACEQGGTCARLSEEYVAALVRARACDPTAAAQCMEMAPDLLECPDCPVWVTATKETAALLGQARAAGCDRCATRCPERPCRALRRGACQPTGGILFPTGHACGEASLLP
jgi:hypothetical protein